jgi:hypothetical protein
MMKCPRSRVRLRDYLVRREPRSWSASSSQINVALGGTRFRGTMQCDNRHGSIKVVACGLCNNDTGPIVDPNSSCKLSRQSEY